MEDKVEEDGSHVDGSYDPTSLSLFGFDSNFRFGPIYGPLRNQ